VAIKFYCCCGKKLKATVKQAGLRGQCTSCGRLVTIPKVSIDAPPCSPASPTDAWWYFTQRGQMYGPLELEDLMQLIADGRLSHRDLLLPPQATSWIALQNFCELLPSPIARLSAVKPTSPLQDNQPAKIGIQFDSRRHVLAEAQVVPDASRCVQCGICSHNCPMDIDVRAHARLGRPIHDSRCLTCSECVQRCPRGVLQFERLSLFDIET